MTTEKRTEGRFGMEAWKSILLVSQRGDWWGFYP